MKLSLPQDWKKELEKAKLRVDLEKVKLFLQKEYQTQIVYPPKEEIFQALTWTPYKDVKVVILGQDPYHGEDQAHGLSFSVRPSVKVPPSLKNIYQALENDLGYPPVSHGYLRSWAEQGVLLLNTVLTVRKGQAHSHQGKGWEELTDALIQSVSRKEEKVVFLLWGRAAQEKKALIDTSRHLILEAAHPSPLSAYRGFFDSRPFSQTNTFLEKQNIKAINWQLPAQVW